jgi:Cd2+/Zn2+-exporting ATPase/Cu+-exporting ATPase
LLEAAAIAERASEHPLAKAIVTRASEAGVKGDAPESFSYLPGKGIVARHAGEEILVGSRAFLDERGVRSQPRAAGALAASEVLVARGGRLLGTLLLEDVLRPEAVQAIRGLQAMGVRTVLLTGDSEAIGRAIADELGVDEAGTQLLPEQKLARIRHLRTAGRVAMVGDGVNDAPALMAADVGVAMGSGTDVARESADVILIGNDLSRFVETVRIARRCRQIIMANVYGTILVDAIGVGLSAFGLLNPLGAAAIHVSSELAFILNSARLLPARGKVEDVVA